MVDTPRDFKADDPYSEFSLSIKSKLEPANDAAPEVHGPDVADMSELADFEDMGPSENQEGESNKEVRVYTANFRSPVWSLASMQHRQVIRDGGLAAEKLMAELLVHSEAAILNAEKTAFDAQSRADEAEAILQERFAASLGPMSENEASPSHLDNAQVGVLEKIPESKVRAGDSAAGGTDPSSSSSKPRAKSARARVTTQQQNVAPIRDKFGNTRPTWSLSSMRHREQMARGGKPPKPGGADAQGGMQGSTSLPEIQQDIAGESDPQRSSLATFSGGTLASLAVPSGDGRHRQLPPLRQGNASLRASAEELAKMSGSSFDYLRSLYSSETSQHERSWRRAAAFESRLLAYQDLAKRLAGHLRRVEKVAQDSGAKGLLEVVYDAKVDLAEHDRLGREAWSADDGLDGPISPRQDQGGLRTSENNSLPSYIPSVKHGAVVE